jgi:hypothetical protein
MRITYREEVTKLQIMNKNFKITFFTSKRGVGPKDSTRMPTSSGQVFTAVSQKLYLGLDKVKQLTQYNNTAPDTQHADHSGRAV